MYKFALLLLMCALVPLQADVLWNQAPDPGMGSAYVDQEFPDFPGYSTYQVNDVTVGAGGWVIDSITGYFGGGQGSWPASLDVRINVFSKGGTLPGAGDDPTAGTEYTAALTFDGTFYEITAAGLGINLAAGDYWIGMTPILEFGTYGQQFHWLTAGIVGDPTAMRNPGGGFGFGTDWGDYSLLGVSVSPADGSMLIQGTPGGGPGTPEPAAYFLMAAGLGALGLLRRRF